MDKVHPARYINESFTPHFMNIRDNSRTLRTLTELIIAWRSLEGKDVCMEGAIRRGWKASKK